MRRRVLGIGCVINHARHTHVERLIPALEKLDKDSHQAIIVISTNIRDATIIVQPSLTAITRVMKLVSRKPQILENPETFHAFGFLLQSTVCHMNHTVRIFRNAHRDLEDLTQKRLTPFLEKNYAHNTQILNMYRKLKDYNVTPRIEVLTDDLDVERDCNDFRDTYEKHGRAALGEYEIGFLLQRSREIADLARFKATLTYPIQDDWYKLEKEKISAMINGLNLCPKIAKREVVQAFNSAEIGCDDPEVVKKAQEKLLGRRNFGRQVNSLADDVSAFFNFAWRISNPGSPPTMRKLGLI